MVEEQIPAYDKITTRELRLRARKCAEFKHNSWKRLTDAPVEEVFKEWGAVAVYRHQGASPQYMGESSADRYTYYMVLLQDGKWRLGRVYRLHYRSSQLVITVESVPSLEATTGAEALLKLQLRNAGVELSAAQDEVDYAKENLAEWTEKVAEIQRELELLTGGGNVE